jgi:hypothetical protein
VPDEHAGRRLPPHYLAQKILGSFCQKGGSPAPYGVAKFFSLQFGHLQGDFREMQGDAVFCLAENLSDPKA